MLHDPRHPYTVGLLRCIPRGGVRKDHGRLDTIPGFLPPIGDELPGCVFADRCALAEDDLPRPRSRRVAPVGGRPRQPLPLPRARAGAAARDGRRPRACRAGRPQRRAAASTIDDLGKIFRQGGHDVHALGGVSAAIWPGETLGLVGESG